jgi:hypothetical protein
MVVQVVEAGWKRAGPFAPVPVPWNSESVKSFKHAGMAGDEQPLVLPRKQVLPSVEPLKRASASTAERGGQRDSNLNQRGDGPARVRFWLSRRSRTGQAASGIRANFLFMGNAMDDVKG